MRGSVGVEFRVYYGPLGWFDGGRMEEGVYEEGGGKAVWGLNWNRGQTVLLVQVVYFR